MTLWLFSLVNCSFNLNIRAISCNTHTYDVFCWFCFKSEDFFYSIFIDNSKIVEEILKFKLSIPSCDTLGSCRSCWSLWVFYSKHLPLVLLGDRESKVEDLAHHVSAEGSFLSKDRMTKDQGRNQPEIGRSRIREICRWTSHIFIEAEADTYLRVKILVCISVDLASYGKTLVARLLPIESRSFLLLVLQAAEFKIKTQAGSEGVWYLLTHCWVYFMWKGQEISVFFLYKCINPVQKSSDSFIETPYKGSIPNSVSFLACLFVEIGYCLAWNFADKIWLELWAIYLSLSIKGQDQGHEPSHSFLTHTFGGDTSFFSLFFN